MAELALIAFADAATVAAVVSLLNRVGYRARRGKATAAARGPRAEQRPLAALLILGRPDPSHAAVRDEIEALAGLPVLALLDDAAVGWNAALIDGCCECARWPCSAAELAFRLERLVVRPALPPTPGPTLDPALAGILTRLNLIGRSPAFLEAVSRLQLLARCDASVLIEGETGTGKELVARAIHYLGGRAGGPFVPLNCGALPDHLVENELFGHARGAYTDARSPAHGAIGEASGGTLFLDEVEALSAKAQAALLRFLQDHEYRPLGAARTCQSDARVLAASNLDLRALIGQRAFRPDLFFRLEVLSIRLPPLRRRKGDIELLARHFIERYRHQYGGGPLELDRRALPGLDDYAWPGNVRELENLVHRAVLLSDGGPLFLSPGPTPAPPDPAAATPIDDIDVAVGFAEAKARAIAAFERRYLTALMQATGGNVTQAARRADKERRALGKLLKKHAIGSAPVTGR
ncbi:MAG: sigma-54 dependent transcriptional regulator [Chromatiaceae bacterium]|jgi:DNA-binding NtrC family response regulator|nr:sigma-54 dependent transcriptional regulator [Chromatiaceae bacterium]